MTPLEESLRYHFKNPEMLRRALTHKSLAYEKREGHFHNEKLEFLGDAVIDLVLGEFLMELFPGDDEGSLSKKRAALVNEEALAEMGRKHDLASELLLGRGEELSGGHAKPRLLSSAWEAVVGAIFLDGGFEAARELLRRDLRQPVANLDPSEAYAADYKTRLQEAAQKLAKVTPTYALLSEEGPPHDRVFTVALLVRDQEVARGCGRSKKVAEQQAASEALKNWAAINPAKGENV